MEEKVTSLRATLQILVKMIQENFEEAELQRIIKMLQEVEKELELKRKMRQEENKTDHWS